MSMPCALAAAVGAGAPDLGGDAEDPRGGLRQDQRCAGPEIPDHPAGGGLRATQLRGDFPVQAPPAAGHEWRCTRGSGPCAASTCGPLPTPGT